MTIDKLVRLEREIEDYYLNNKVSYVQTCITILSDLSRIDKMEFAGCMAHEFKDLYEEEITNDNDLILSNLLHVFRLYDITLDQYISASNIVKVITQGYFSDEFPQKWTQEELKQFISSTQLQENVLLNCDMVKILIRYCIALILVDTEISNKESKYLDELEQSI